MDMLLFWVTLGFLVEATRAAIRKSCSERRKKEPDTLREPLLKPEEVVDALGNCRLACCAHKLGDDAQDELEEEYFLETSDETSEEESYVSDLPDRLSSITEDSEEDLEEPGVKIVKWEDLWYSVSVTVVGVRSSSKGKEIVEEREEEITRSDMPRPEIAHAIIRKESRWKNSAKIYPEPLHPPPTSLQDEGRSSYDYALKTSDQAAWDCNFKADIKVPAFTGECSK